MRFKTGHYFSLVASVMVLLATTSLMVSAKSPLTLVKGDGAPPDQNPKIAIAYAFIWNYDADYDDHRLGRTLQRLRR